MKMVRCCLRMQISKRDGKCIFPNSSMMKCWKIFEFEVGLARVVKGILIFNWVNLLGRTRLESP